MDNRIYFLSLLWGILSEVVLFSRGDWVQSGPKIVLGLAQLTTGYALFFWVGLRIPLGAALGQTILHVSVFLNGLFGSMAVYRVFFHPLRAFPGPIGARVTAFWALRESIPDLRFYQKLCKLHDQYGDFVRISRCVCLQRDSL